MEETKNEKLNRVTPYEGYQASTTESWSDRGTVKQENKSSLETKNPSTYVQSSEKDSELSSNRNELSSSDEDEQTSRL